MSLRVGVIGAGLGGLSAAVQLAAKGHRVSLFERSGLPGGKASRFESRGYSFDTGPSLLTMPETIDELFAAAGDDRRKHLEFLRLPTQCRYFFADGRKVDLVDDQAETMRNIGALEPRDAAGFAKFLGVTKEIYDSTGKPFLERPFEGFWSFAKNVAARPIDSLRWGALQGSLGRISRRHLKSDALRWIVDRYATYAGGGPARSPAAFAMIVHIETAMGAWYPRGGIFSIAREVEALAKRTGVELHYGADVERINVKAGRIQGLRVGGVDEPFDAIVSNADPVFVGQRLLAPEDAKTAGLLRHAKQDLGTSGFVVMLGVKGRLDHLAHHNVVFPAQYPDEFTDLFDREEEPRDPTIYLCIPSRTELTRAPAGSESVFAMINAPATAGKVDWKAKGPAIVERIKGILETRVIPDLRGRIEVEHVIGPDQLRERFNAPGGSIYGVTPHGLLSPFHRPMPRAKGLHGLYFAGGGTQPGGGIPLVVRSGRFAAELLEKDVISGRISAGALTPRLGAAA